MIDRNAAGVPAHPNDLRYDPAAQPPQMDAEPNALRYDPEAEPIELDEHTRINPTLVPKAGGVYSYDIVEPAPEHPQFKDGKDPNVKKAEAAERKKKEAEKERREAEREATQQPAGSAERGTLVNTPPTEQAAEDEHQRALAEKKAGTGEFITQHQRTPTAGGEAGVAGAPSLSRMPGPTGATGATGATGPRG